MDTSPFIAVVTSLFHNVNIFLNSIVVPGLNVTFGSFYVALFAVGVCMSLLTIWLGIGVRSRLREDWSGGNNRNMKISENRKGDNR